MAIGSDRTGTESGTGMEAVAVTVGKRNGRIVRWRGLACLVDKRRDVERVGREAHLEDERVLLSEKARHRALELRLHRRLHRRKAHAQGHVYTYYSSDRSQITD